MKALNLAEAQLLRMLSGLFGGDRVIPFMSVQAVCGGDLPADYEVQDFDLRGWARRSTCLFTVVDDDSSPRAVFEIFPDFTHSVEYEAVQHEKYLRPLLNHLGIRYITITNQEFDEILSSRGRTDFVSFIRARLEDESD